MAKKNEKKTTIHLEVVKKQKFFKARKTPTPEAEKGLKWATLHLPKEATYEDSIRFESLVAAIESPQTAAGKRLSKFLQENF